MMTFKEAGRVVKASGSILLDFTPYYNPIGSAAVS
jgi:hypothetical protein